MKANLANRPSIARIREVLAYDSETGILTWRISFRRAIAGREAGNFDPAIGYHRLRIDGVAILSHHVAWALVKGYWPEEIDHVHGRQAGNMWSNLREATRSQNMGNTGLPANNKSGFKGVSFHRSTGKWQAQIGINGKRTSLGVYDTKEAAAEAYAKAAKEHWGEFYKP